MCFYLSNIAFYDMEELGKITLYKRIQTLILLSIPFSNQEADFPA